MIPGSRMDSTCIPPERGRMRSEGAHGLFPGLLHDLDRSRRRRPRTFNQLRRLLVDRAKMDLCGSSRGSGRSIRRRGSPTRPGPRGRHRRSRVRINIRVVIITIVEVNPPRLRAPRSGSDTATPAGTSTENGANVSSRLRCRYGSTRDRLSISCHVRGACRRSRSSP